MSIAIEPKPPRTESASRPFVLDEINDRLRALYGSAKVSLRTVLEAGGGSLSHFVLPADATLVALDIDTGQLIRNESTPYRIQGDLHYPPTASACVDVVICFNVIEHLQDPERALRGIGRMLRSGGLLILGCPLRDSLKGLLTRALPLWFRRLYYRLIVGKKDRGGGHHDVFETYFRPVVSRTELPRFLERLGMSIEWLHAYDGAREFQITAGGPARRMFGLPYYALAWLGTLATAGRWRAAESDLFVIARKSSEAAP